MNILFLDLSTKSTGYCISDEDGKMITYGLITASSENNIARIVKIQTEVTNLIQQYDIKKIVAEDVHPDEYGYSDTARILLWLQGAVMINAHLIDSKINSKSLELMQANEWRKQLGIKVGPKIKRQELKLSDIKYVKNTYNIDANDDVCDAICLYTAYFINKQKQENVFDWR